MVRGANPAVVTIADKVSSDKGFQIFNEKGVRNIATIEKFGLHSGPHTFTASIVVIATTRTIHALSDVVFGNGIAVSITRIL